MTTELIEMESSLPAAIQQQTVMERLLVAVQSGLQPELLEKFMELAERQERRDAEKAYHKAFAAFKTDPPEIVKDRLVEYKGTRYKHASIGNVVSAIIGGMSAHGLSHRWNIHQDGGNITVTCVITHEMGHSEETPLSAGADTSGGKNAIQAIASTVTYLQRYTLQAATGIAVLEDDDDGNGAENITQPEQHNKRKEKEPPPDRTAIDAWLKWLDGAKSPGVTKEIFSAEWAKNKMDDVCNSLHPDHQEELLAKEAEVIKYLEGNNAK